MPALADPRRLPFNPRMSSDCSRTDPGRYAGHDGEFFGGQYVAPNLLPVLDRLDAAYRAALTDRAFARAFAGLLADHVGRPTPIMMIEPDSAGASIVLKREDLTNTGGSFGGSALGQCLLAQRMGMRAVVADTGSGDHGVATAAAAARLGLAATIYLAVGAGKTQTLMIDQMRSFGATVVTIAGEAGLLHHAMSGAIQHWMAHAATCLYVAGGPIGPHPYPALVHHFQATIGREARLQLVDRFGRLPDAAVASMDGGGAAIGLFGAFVDDPTRLILAEPGGRGGMRAAALSHGRPGILHGAHTMLLQDEDGQLRDVRSEAPGLAYPAAPPELAAWFRRGRVEVTLVDDADAVATMRWSAERLGLLMSIETAYACAQALRSAASLPADGLVVVAVSAGGAKDLPSFGPAA